VFWWDHVVALRFGKLKENQASDILSWTVYHALSLLRCPIGLRSVLFQTTLDHDDRLVMLHSRQCRLKHRYKHELPIPYAHHNRMRIRDAGSKSTEQEGRAFPLHCMVEFETTETCFGNLSTLTTRSDYPQIHWMIAQQPYWELINLQLIIDSSWSPHSILCGLP